MKKMYVMILTLLMVTSALMADNAKNILARISVTSLPFDCRKDTRYPYPGMGYPAGFNSKLPLEMYQDLGLTQKIDDDQVITVVFRKFKPKETKYELVAVDISVSDWDKKLLVTYEDGELVDYIEAEVGWYSGGILCVKQWRIDADENIIVTWLKVDTTKPISAFSMFDSVQAQRIDTYYRLDANGKFKEVKQVKYRPQTYPRTSLIEKNKNIWEGKEVPIQ